MVWASLLIPLRAIAQNRCRVEFRFRFRTSYCLMHGIRAKVKAAGPLHAAEMGIRSARVEDPHVQQVQKYAADPPRTLTPPRQGTARRSRKDGPRTVPVRSASV